jgi:lipoate-protein ligase A
MTWVVERETGDPAVFHGRPMPSPAARTAWAFVADRPALVLGSTQPESDVDHAALDRAGVALVRRRSGGGAVLLEPGEAAWLDVIVPRGDERWRDDVVAAPCWLGDVWATALAALGVDDLHVHRGRLQPSPWGRLVCFAGLGSGEVTSGGRKVVGISQRRTREAARFQCVALRRWDPDALVALLALDDPGRATAIDELHTVATGTGLDTGTVLDAVLDRLPE